MTPLSPVGLKHLDTYNFLKLSSSLHHPCQITEFSSDSSSSYPFFRLHKLFMGMITGATKPKGSYIELTPDNILLRIGVFSWSKMRKPKLSDSISHWMPNVQSVGRSSKTRLTTDGALFVTGLVAITFLSLLSSFVKQNPPLG